jgi:hypothetical protein
MSIEKVKIRLQKKPLKTRRRTWIRGTRNKIIYCFKEHLLLPKNKSGREVLKYIVGGGGGKWCGRPGSSVGQFK